MNETDRSVIDSIAGGLESERTSHPNWIDVHKLRYWKSGDKYMVDFHLIVPYYQTVSESHETMHTLEDTLIKLTDNHKVESLIHLDPCNPKCCHICSMPECPVRSETVSDHIKWTGEKIVSYASYDIDEIS
jgi:divalent metal cation (Fe/Co/Zn/Cd) transporter